MTPTHKLTVLIGFNSQSNLWEAEYIKFDDVDHYDFGEESLPLPANAKPGIRALCLLAVLVKQARFRGAAVVIPAKLKEHLKPYWNSRYKADWPKTLFGENPLGKYIHASQRSGDFFLNFDKSVEIEIDYTGLKTGQHPPTWNKFLSQYYTSDGPPEEDTPLIINVHKAGHIISNIEQKGFVRTGNQIKLEITAPIEESICVFWIDSEDNGLFSLFPTLDSRLNLSEKEACYFSSDDGFRTHRIPAKRTIGISGDGGIETCLVLRRRETFTKADESEMQGIIEQILEDRNPTLLLEEPRYLYGTADDFRNMDRQVSETRLEPGWQVESWEAQLSQQLEPHYEWLHLLHIPNRGAQVT